MTIPHDSTGIDALVRAIESLQERIRNDGDTIRSDEIRTRTALVDPLLTALGWDTTDPRMVIPEYRIGDLKVDYALVKVPKGRRRAKPVAFVEAKRMVEYLGDHRRQVFNYAYAGGVKYGCLTNGVRWVLYDVFNKDAPRNDRRVVDVSLRHEPAFDCAVKLLLLQATNLEHGMRLSITGAQALLDRAIETSASPAVVELLLDRGADVATKDSAGWTPLHDAVARNARQSVIELLLKRGADTTAADSRGWTPLHHAVASIGRCVAPGCGRILHPQERVCKPDEGGCGMVQFTICIQCWRDTRLNHIEPGGLCAVCAGSGEADPLAVVAMLLDHGADIEARSLDDCTPLHAAVRYNPNTDTLSLLLDRGADIEARAPADFTPLHVAAIYNSNPDIISALVERGADIEARNIGNMTPLLSANLSNSNPEITTRLLDCGADIEAKDSGGWTLLHRIVGWNTEPTEVKALLDRGADVTATDELGRTPLHCAAAFNSNPEVAALLLDHGADIAAKTQSYSTPLHIAARNNTEPTVAELLIQRGGDVMAKNRLGQTPMHSAMMHNPEPSVIEILLNNGADITATDIFGNTPHQLAKERGANEELLRLLRV